MGLKLVIADDAPFIREVMKHILRQQPFEIVGEAANGEEVVKIALEKKPDIILMDIVMPIMSGIEATIEILKKLPSTKIIACSTEGQDSMVTKAIEAGCCSFIVKPFKLNDLLNVVNNAAEGE